MVWLAEAQYVGIACCGAILYTVLASCCWFPHLVGVKSMTNRQPVEKPLAAVRQALRRDSDGISGCKLQRGGLTAAEMICICALFQLLLVTFTFYLNI